MPEEYTLKVNVVSGYLAFVDMKKETIGERQKFMITNKKKNTQNKTKQKFWWLV